MDLAAIKNLRLMLVSTKTLTEDTSPFVALLAWRLLLHRLGQADLFLIGPASVELHRIDQVESRLYLVLYLAGIQPWQKLGQGDRWVAT